MIINGGSRSNGAFFAKHLVNGEHNERVTLCEIRNLVAVSIADAFREMAAVAMGTLCRNYFYHANINPMEHELLTQAQWATTADTLERNLGLDDHARFIVEHQKKGRIHRHIIWSRINVRTMRAVVMANDYERHQATARELEKEFGLTGVPSVLGETRASGPRPSRRPKSWESFRGQQTGIDPWEMKQTITKLYQKSKNAAAFKALLFEHGFELIRGTRTDCCLRDASGHLHSLTRRIDGVSATALRTFLMGAL
jgi:hypothetical protein